MNPIQKKINYRTITLTKIRLEKHCLITSPMREKYEDLFTLMTRSEDEARQTKQILIQVFD